MKFITSFHDFKHKLHHKYNSHQKPENAHMPHKLVDAPPYSSIYVTSHGFEAPARRNLLLNYERANHEKAHYDGKVEDNIDADAEDYIKLKHKNFLRGDSYWSTER
ncbi:hypothetical protein POM88_002862 [Heracleum sosnowskyi]|uniref:Uncharacterized protein n=1 Tax=Heracleum sosnowskyi TaxID=360622 RepID=A0AAD8JIQ8_9APIA|nr:hypothetical protein POM88_002862 [Heracleum sosnowskyi]